MGERTRTLAVGKKKHARSSDGGETDEDGTRPPPRECSLDAVLRPEAPGAKDGALKPRIEEILHEHPSSGHRRIALALGEGKKRIRSVMRRFGIRPYRRRPKRLRKRWDEGAEPMPYGNLLPLVMPDRPDLAWVSDVTLLRFWEWKVYLATVLDACTREVVGASLLTGHSTPLVFGAFEDALRRGRKPVLLHSDQGSAYRSRTSTRLVEASWGLGLHEPEVLPVGERAPGGVLLPVQDRPRRPEPLPDARGARGGGLP